MMARISLSLLVAISLSAGAVRASEALFSFDTAPLFEAPQSGVGIVTLADGEWGTQQDGIDNLDEIPPVPVWNPGGWIQPIGTETPTLNRGPVGFNNEGLDINSIKTNIFTGVIVFNETAWGDVSTATHVTLDVKGSFAGSGGLTVSVGHDEDVIIFGEAGTASWWSWGANATDASVGANPGDVTDWTTVLIPINRPATEDDEGKHGNWGSNLSASPFDSWDSVFADVNVIAVRGLTPDSQIDNLGFVLPDVGIAGDFDGDTDVDGDDFLEWQLDQTGRDLSDWETNYGNGALSASLAAVPEPCAALLLTVGGLLSLFGGRRSYSN